MNTGAGKILSCIDGSMVSEAVCDYASWAAKRLEAPLSFMHTIEHTPVPLATDYSGAIGLGSREGLLGELAELEQKRSRLLIQKGQDILNFAKERAASFGIENAESQQRHGTLSESLIGIENDIRMLVLGIRGQSHEAEKKGVGMQLESVIRSLHKPILVVNTAFTEPENVMLAYDGSPSCEKALQLVASSPLFKGITCHIVHVGKDSRYLLKEAEDALLAVGINVVTAQLSGTIDEALKNYQSGNAIDLMLMGAFSHNRFRDLLLGSFTAKMLHSTNRPLLLLR